jgi:hypothetical protein
VVAAEPIALPAVDDTLSPRDEAGRLGPGQGEEPGRQDRVPPPPVEATRPFTLAREERLECRPCQRRRRGELEPERLAERGHRSQAHVPEGTRLEPRDGHAARAARGRESGLRQLPVPAGRPQRGAKRVESHVLCL